MAQKNNNANKAELRYSRQLKTDLILRIAYGPMAKETARNWLRDVNGISKAVMELRGRREAGQAWMQGISCLSESENTAEASFKEHEREFSSMGVRASTIGLVDKRSTKRFAATCLRQLRQAVDFAISKDLINQRDALAAQTAGKTTYDAILAAEAFLLSNPWENSKSPDTIRNKINRALRKSD